MADPLSEALVAEACGKSALVWLRCPGDQRSHAAWHVWAEGAVCLVTGGAEQPLTDAPDLADGSEVDVLVRSKDNGARLVAFRTVVSEVVPGTAEWDTVVPLLHAKRLNAARRRGAAGAVGPRVPRAAPGPHRSGARAAGPPADAGRTRPSRRRRRRPRAARSRSSSAAGPAAGPDT